MSCPQDVTTDLPELTLICPVVERDAKNGVEWLAGSDGRDTLRAMGVSEENNHPSTIDEERTRVRNFIDRTDQLNWMISYQNKIIGSVWVDLVDAEYVAVPSIHIMIGDLDQRGKGIGKASMSSVMSYLQSKGYATVYTRHLVSNNKVAGMNNKLGFTLLGSAYEDNDGLCWQNYVKRFDIVEVHD